MNDNNPYVTAARRLRLLTATTRTVAHILHAWAITCRDAADHINALRGTADELGLETRDQLRPVAMREIVETSPGVWTCEACKECPEPAILAGDLSAPVAFGACGCVGWRAVEQPELVAAVRAVNASRCYPEDIQ